MTISFTPNTNTKAVEVEGYGIVKVRQYGAGEELQIAKNLRELDELKNKATSLLETMRKDYGENEKEYPENFKKDFDLIQTEVSRLTTELNELVKGIISSDDPQVAERVFAELPMSEIRRLISMVRGKDTNAETK